jgi:formylglycine-generating enzyme required for sulfatase activity
MWDWDHELWLEFFEGIKNDWELLSGAVAIWPVQHLAKKVRKKIVDRKNLYKNLKPFYMEYEIKRATENYVPTKCQNVDPSAQNEPGNVHAFVTREELIPFFTDKVFKNKKEEKYYLVLADSGMGKTTFMINLFLTYIKKPDPNYKIVLLPLGHEKTDAKIDKIKIEEKYDTILLLDAFDEDPKAVKDYKKRLDAIIQKTKDFQTIIITSRTQFFPSDSEIPKETGIYKFGGDKKEHKFYKIYISPFDDNDIEKYLKNKYHFYERSKMENARDVVKKSPNLMVRPMLLAHIDDLIGEKEYDYTYEIYEVMVKKWIERERVKNKKELRRFCREVAKDIYKFRKSRKGLYIDGDDIKNMAEQHQIKLDEFEMKGRSLLNRNAEGQYKFAHKSILEYFLALEVFENKDFEQLFDFEGMEQAKKFYEKIWWNEIGIPFDLTFVNGGTFQMGDTFGDGYDREKPVHDVILDDFYISKYPLTVGQFKKFIDETGYKTDAEKAGWSYVWTGSDYEQKDGVNWRCDIEGNIRPESEYTHPVIHVSWNDAKAFCDHYGFNLPTEAQWEYAARGGNKSNAYKYAGSNTPDDVAWYDSNSGRKTHPVGEKKPNELGIYDMSGNVLEWCRDWYDENYYQYCKNNNIRNNPENTKSMSRRVLRGGLWSSNEFDVRVSNRFSNNPGLTINYVGFRFSRVISK